MGAINLQSAAAYTAAGAMTLASAGTNVVGAITKQSDLPAQIISGTIAGSTAILVSVSLAAAITSFSKRRMGAGIASLTAFCLAGAFSISSALGVLGGVRLQASASVEHVETERNRLGEERRRASIELGTISAASRPAAEINAQVAALLALPGMDNCAVINGPVTRQHCPTVARLQSEVAAAQRRSALEGTLTRIDSDLAKLGSPKIANGDAEAIRAVAKALGYEVSAERLNVGLMVLSVLLLELGGGLALATAHALRADQQSDSGTARPSESPGSFTPLTTPVRAAPKPVMTGDSGDSSVIRSGLDHATVNPLSVRATQVLDSLRLAGGSATGSQRALAQQLGVSQPVLSRSLSELFEQGVIELRADRKTGTSVRVVSQG